MTTQINNETLKERQNKTKTTKTTKQTNKQKTVNQSLIFRNIF